MACLVPQFKCPPDILAIHFTAHTHHLFKARQPVCVRAQCLLTTTATMPTATVVDMAKLHLASLESHSHSVAADRSLTYMASIGPPSKTNFKEALVTETLTGEEAVVAAAAAEAVALAKAAVEVAKNAASMIGYNPSTSLGHKPAKPDSNDFWFERAGLIDTEQAIGLHSLEAETVPEEHSVHISTNVEDNLDPTDEELKLLQMQLSESVAVRSGRQTERKVKRSKAAEKAASSVVSVNTGTSSRKKRSAAQDIDYSDPLRFLRGVGSSKLLTANEETQLSEGIQVLLKLERLRDDLVERYGEDPTLAQWAAAAGIDQKTLKKRINYGTICKDKMIKCNIRLVISIAKNYQRQGMSFQDLVQEGCRGLVRGAEKFDAAKGFKFSTYAHWWIKQAVRKSLSDRSRTIRLPFHMVEATYRVKEAKKLLYMENGRDPNQQEIADATGLSMKRLQAVLLTPKPPKSLDRKFGIDGTLKLSEIVADPNAETSEGILLKKCMREDLDKVLGSLNIREKQVIRWRFGLEDGRMKTLQEIGELMGVSRERIRQIESCAFRKLKNKKRTKNLQQYMVS